MHSIEEQTVNITFDLANATPIDNDCALTLYVMHNQFFGYAPLDTTPTSELHHKHHHASNDNDFIYAPNTTGSLHSNSSPGAVSYTPEQQLIALYNARSDEHHHHALNDLYKPVTQHETPEQTVVLKHVNNETKKGFSEYLTGLRKEISILTDIVPEILKYL